MPSSVARLRSPFPRPLRLFSRAAAARAAHLAPLAASSSAAAEIMEAGVAGALLGAAAYEGAPGRWKDLDKLANDLK